MGESFQSVQIGERIWANLCTCVQRDWIYTHYNGAKLWPLLLQWVFTLHLTVKCTFFNSRKLEVTCRFTSPCTPEGFPPALRLKQNHVCVWHLIHTHTSRRGFPSRNMVKPFGFERADFLDLFLFIVKIWIRERSRQIIRHRVYFISDTYYLKTTFYWTSWSY